MKKLLLFICLSIGLTALGGSLPALKSVRVSIAPYVVPAGCSNAVIVVYKSTSLGSVYSPPKPCAIFPASRTNTTIALLVGTYKFYATAQMQPLGESVPGETVTYQVQP